MNTLFLPYRKVRPEYIFFYFLGLKDQNAYVRKNAIMCVPKVYEISPELIERENLIKTVKDIFNKDTNYDVVANAI